MTWNGRPHEASKVEFYADWPEEDCKCDKKVSFPFVERGISSGTPSQPPVVPR